MESYAGKKKWQSAISWQPTGRPAAYRAASRRPAVQPAAMALAVGRAAASDRWPAGRRAAGERPGPVGWRPAGLPAATQPASSCGLQCALELFFVAST